MAKRFTKKQQESIFQALRKAGHLAPHPAEQEETERLRLAAWRVVEEFLAVYWPEGVRESFRLFDACPTTSEVYLPGLGYASRVPVVTGRFDEDGCYLPRSEGVEVPDVLRVGLRRSQEWGFLREFEEPATEAAKAWQEHLLALRTRTRERRETLRQLLRDLPAERFLAEAPPAWRPVVEAALADGQAPPAAPAEAWKVLF